MRWAVIGLILLGVIAAASAALLMVSFQARTKGTLVAEVADSPAPVDVLVAAKTLAAGTILDADSVKKTVVAKKEAPTGCFADPVQVAGRMLIKSMSEGEALKQEYVMKENDSPAEFAASIPPGLVAMSIPVGNYVSSEGLFYPGCLVNVLVTLTPQTGKAICRTILHGVRVLAINGSWMLPTTAPGQQRLTPRTGGGERTVTLAVTPEQGKQLQVAMAMGQGSLSLALLNPLQPNSPDTGIFRGNDLMGEDSDPSPVGTATRPSEPTAPGEGEPQWKMDVIRGEERSSVLLPIQNTGTQETGGAANR